jgi:hypothetical protein
VRGREWSDNPDLTETSEKGWRIASLRKRRLKTPPRKKPIQTLRKLMTQR